MYLIHHSKNEGQAEFKAGLTHVIMSKLIFVCMPNLSWQPKIFQALQNMSDSN